MKRFSGLKARDYEFKNPDGTSRHVIALYMGNKQVGFMEYETARRFIDRIGDLCEVHERDQQEESEEK